MIGKVLRRTGIALLSVVLFLVVSLYATLHNITHGASPAMRNILILAASQASATKWMPGLFFSEDFIQEVLEASEITESVSVSDLMPPRLSQSVPASHLEVTPAPTETEESSPEQTPVPTPEPEPDPWEDAIDGMILDTYYGSTFKAYILLVKDPARVFTAKCKGDFGYNTNGMRALELIEDESIIAAINGGGFYDPGGAGSGGVPLGLTYSQGECLWDDGAKLTFVGFDKDNKLVASDDMTRELADELGIRDGVCFETKNVLISNEDGEVSAHYAGANTSLSQRTAIGQAADGTVILMVTEGRTASYMGANRYDIINAMLSYGAVTAAMLDGGSSTVMLYRDYVEKYGVDESNLSKYQKQGIVNSSRAFLNQRKIPTYFAVRTEE